MIGGEMGKVPWEKVIHWHSEESKKLASIYYGERRKTWPLCKMYFFLGNFLLDHLYIRLPDMRVICFHSCLPSHFYLCSSTVSFASHNSQIRSFHFESRRTSYFIAINCPKSKNKTSPVNHWDH